MNKDNFYVVIVAGGTGTRLWPMSRKKSPKQFQRLTGKKTLFQQTFRRIKKVAPISNIFVSLGGNYLKTARQQLPQIPKKNYIIEPVGKNTAPAIALASLIIRKRNPNAIIASIASDHEVLKEDVFAKNLKLAFKIVSEHPKFLITIGLQPTYPETGYGYIKTGEPYENYDQTYWVEKFVEKPNELVAQTYFQTTKYLWNASYFIFNAKHILKLYESHSRRIYRLIEKIDACIDAGESYYPIFHEMPNEPFDTEIIEKINKVLVISSDMGWSDVGSWKSVYEILAKKIGSDQVSQGHHISYGDENVFVLGQKKMIATIGLKNIAVIDTPDATLIINRDKSQDVKKIIEQLKETGKHKYL